VRSEDQTPQTSRPGLEQQQQQHMANLCPISRKTTTTHKKIKFMFRAGLGFSGTTTKILSEAVSDEFRPFQAVPIRFSGSAIPPQYIP